MQRENKTAEYLTEQYTQGNRVFTRLDFSSDTDNSEKFKNIDLSGCLFYQCFFHSCEFQSVVLKGSEFIECNLKCLVMSNCDLSDAKIVNCSVEANLWNNIKTDNITFLLNDHYGATLLQEDFEAIKKDFEKVWIEQKNK